MEQLTDENFTEKTAQGVCVIDFSATWCGPCRMMKPIFEQVADAFKVNPSVRFFQVDVDQCPRSAASFGVESIPTLLVLKDGAPVDVRVGVTSPVDLQKLVSSALG